MTAIRSLKNGKALDRSASLQSSSRQTQSLQYKFFKKKQQPNNWKGVSLCSKTLKNESLSNYNSWRGITLLSVPSKILASLIIYIILCIPTSNLYTTHYLPPSSTQTRWLFSQMLEFIPSFRVVPNIGWFSFCLNRSEEHTSELQSRQYLVCRLLLEKKKK